jgi:DNA-binding SARP family transcriptional activator
MLEVRAGGNPVEIRAAKVRALLAMLALHAGQVLSAEGLVPPCCRASSLRTAIRS